MEKLNSYLQQLLNTNGLELHLEPNKNPYINTASGQVNAATAPLPGAQINSMIFSLIPDKVKQQLPNQPEVEFVHPHNLGSFSFCVKKSPAGFNVTITPGGEVSADSEPGHEDEVSLENQHSENSSEDQTPADEQLIERADSEPAEAVAETIEEPTADPVQPGSPEVGEMAPEYTLDAVAPAETPVIPEVEEPSSGQSIEDTFQSFESGAIEIEVEVEGNDSSYQTEYPEVETATPEAEPVPTNFTENPVVDTTIPTNEFETAEHSSHDAINQEPVVEQTIEMNHTPTASPVVPQQSVQETSFTPANPKDRAEMDELFRQMADGGASDLHLSVSMPPLIRKDGKMRELAPGAAKLTPESIERLLSSIIPDKNREEFAERFDTDFAYEIAGLARFRANIFRDRKGMGGVFRIIPSEILTAEDLKLSKAIMGLTELSKGLVVVTGPTGSGKSTTLCAMVDSINKTREDHIITIEDPIEFTHENLKCLVNQREVHNHTKSFKDALRAALREDPDILLVGEMRDLETISIAIETAETGHLVFGTLHTTTAASTIDRIIDQFPADRQQQIRVMLSESLKGVIAQTLLPKIGGGRIAALEVLIVTPAVANLIREGKTFQIPSQMQTGKNLGMQMLNDSLMDLVNNGLVEPKDAYIKSVDKDGFETLLKRNGKKL